MILPGEARQICDRLRSERDTLSLAEQDSMLADLQQFITLEHWGRESEIERFAQEIYLRTAERDAKDVLTASGESVFEAAEYFIQQRDEWRAKRRQGE
ncbi:hypothetical protein [Allohahella sp. A8]|uniref:hypothetical protein n=1 Tax=Allohahella sp. A8 TaxID=3141461 RepID=UPI003A805BB6